eukprot:SAG11_NODE_3369_length_2493_cov_2.073935_2_plen_92_part_00
MPNDAERPVSAIDSFGGSSIDPREISLRSLMLIRHSLTQSATQKFVPRRYFFVRYRVGTSGPEIYRIFAPSQGGNHAFKRGKFSVKIKFLQ